MKQILLAIFGIMFFLGCSAKQPFPPPATVASLDLNRYTGTWYEIARYENRFEIGCVGATADYAVDGDHIAVTNTCYNETGKMSAQVHGKAYTVENSKNTKLRVTFFWPFYGDYWVVMLADDYRYSVVGDPSGRYLWILARNNRLDDMDKKTILSSIPALGYDPDKLYWTNVSAYPKP